MQPQPDPRTPTDLANELYARGCFTTRPEAQHLATTNPAAALDILHIERAYGELTNPLDTATIEDWGHADTGQAGT